MIIIPDAWIFTVLWGEWHPITDLSGRVTVDDQYDIDLAPIDGRPEIQLVLDKAGGLSNTQGTRSTKRLYFREMPQGVERPVLAIEGLRRAFGFEQDQVAWYVKLNPNNRGLDTRTNRARNEHYGALYCFLGDENQQGTPDTDTLMPTNTSKNIRSGWLFLENSRAIKQEPPNDGPIPGLPEKRFVILNGRYGALTGPGRELYFLNGVDSTYQQQVWADFDFPPGTGTIVNGIRAIKADRDVLIEIT
jgi:hypothetical protein